MNDINLSVREKDSLQNLSIHSLLKNHARRTPDAVAIAAPGRLPLTYERLRHHVMNVAGTLTRMGIGPNDRIAIVLPNGPEMVTSFLAVAMVATGAPLNQDYNTNEFEFYLSDLNAKALLTQSGLKTQAVDLARAKDIPIIEISPLLESEAGIFKINGEVPSNPTHRRLAEAGDVALVLHTSGTTSRPKIVPLTHTNILTSAHNVQSALKLVQSDLCLNVMPLFHIHGLMGATLSSLLAGAGIVCTPGFNVSGFYEWLKDFRPTWYTAVPTIHQSILGAVPEHRQTVSSCSVRFIRSCSSPLPPSVMLGLEDAFKVPVIESYGMTEAAHQMTSNPMPPRERKAGSVGIAAGPEVATMDLEGNLLPPLETGEIVIRGDNVTPGYENNPDANKASFKNGWFRTGDQGFLDNDGYLYISGRLKEIINRGGEKIAPREIDEILLEHPAVKQAVTFAVPHLTLGEDVAAAIVLQENELSTEREIREFAFDRLSNHKVPSQVIFVSEIPKGPTGKLQRIGLAKKLAPELKGEFVAPEKPVEEILSNIWAEALGVERVGTKDNFFALGGDSLKALDVVYSIGKTFQVTIPMKTIFKGPTVADQALLIESIILEELEDLTEEEAQRLIKKTSPSAAKRALLEKRLSGEFAEDRKTHEIIPDPEKRHVPFPLNDIQQAYWIGRGGIFELGNVSTHTYLEFECIDLDIDRIKRAWQQLIIRHDMLRAVVLPDGMQKILQQVPPYEIEILDLRGQEQKVIDSGLNTVHERMSHQVLPSDQWPLFEIRASLLDDNHFRLHLSFDALICDAWSRSLLFQEWSELYRNPHAQLSPLEISFRDYILGETELRDPDLYQRSQDYWNSRLNSLPPAPELPVVKNPASVKKPRFTRRKARLAPEHWSRLKSRASGSGLTPSGVLLAVYAAVLRLWSKNPRFTVNLTLFNRLPLHPHVNNIVGDFTSLTLLEVDNSKEDRFEAYAQRLQQQLFDDLGHLHVSGVQVMRELVRTHGGTGRAVMPVVFTSLLPHESRSNGKKSINWMGDVVYEISQTPQVWIDLIVDEEAGALMLKWNAVEELFPEKLLDDMFEAYCHLLQRLVDKEETWQESWHEMAAALTPSAQLVQRTAINSTEVAVSDELLHTLFVKQVPQRLAQPAIMAPNQTLTYEDLFLKSKQLGRRLRQLGARPNSLVGVVMEKGWEQVVAVLGVLSSGAAYLPMDPELPQERLQYLLDHGGVKLVLTQQRLIQSLGGLNGIRMLCVDDEEVLNCDKSPLETVQAAGDLAYVIYTSGSTGTPKGVMIDHRGAVNTILDINQRFGVGPEDRVLAISSLSFDLSVYDIFGLLAAGGTIVIPEKGATRDPAQWAALIREKRVTIWNSVPTLMALLVEYLNNRVELANDSLRLVLMSGDWVPLSLPDQIKQILSNVEVVSLGGATEASIWSIIYPIASVDPSWTSIPYGKPMTNQKFYVLDEALAHRPAWVPGKLYIGGIGLARGYWQDEEKTRASFFNHPQTRERLYLTGDMGRYLPDGNIEFLGREDFQVKIQGFRVELGEIESALMEHRAVKEVVINAVGQSHNEKRLVAYIVSQQKPAPDAGELRHFLAKKIPDYMLPVRFIYMEHLPLTSNGKVDRNALPLPAESDDAVSFTAPRETEAIIARITELVMSVLKITDLEANTNLLDLGANSIDMIRIANLLEEELSFRPKIDEFFGNPSVLALSEMFELQKMESLEFSEALPDTLLPTPESVLDSFELILDPEAREDFKNTQPGIRRGDNDRPLIRVIASQPEGDLKTKYAKRYSHRQFASAPISFAQFGNLICCLRQIELSGKPKYLYGSAGGIYPVQTYLYIKPDGVESLPGGIYYYHPVEDSLLRLSVNDEFDREVYEPLINRPIFDEGAFAIFFIAQLKAIVPLYGDRSIHFATIEAGLMTQLLEMSAPSCGIGLCQIGSLEFQRIEHLFDLDDSHVLIHSLIGGLIDNN